MRIALVTGDPVFRLGFQTLIETTGDMRWAGGTGDRPWGFQDIDADRPDVLVIDVSQLGVRAAQAVREVARRAPGLPVLLVTDWGRERDAIEVLAAGGNGLALKTDEAEELLAAIRVAGQGRIYVAPAFRRFGALKAACRNGHAPCGVVADVLGGLSRREREVFDLLVRGWGSATIAEQLGISMKTVDTHRTRIQRKLGCDDSIDLIRFAAENDLLRRSPSGWLRPGRTVLLMVDDDAPLRAKILCQGARLWRPVPTSVNDGPDGDPQPVLSEICGQLLRAAPPPATASVLSTLEQASRRLALRVAASLPSCNSLASLVTVIDGDQDAEKPDLPDAVAYRKLPGAHARDEPGDHPGSR
jgi:DNA-binding NarL/FixJ family response regulator